MPSRILPWLLLAAILTAVSIAGSTLVGQALAVTTDSVQSGRDSFDLDGLIKAVSSTKAIGFLTKLSLKRDIDKFQADLTAFHARKTKVTLEQLEERYDLMVDNLLVLVQDDDKALADDIVAARDDLWATLADADAYAKL